MAGSYAWIGLRLRCFDKLATLPGAAMFRVFAKFIFRLIGWGARLVLRLLEVKLRYRRGVGDDYSKAVETIRALKVP